MPLFSRILLFPTPPTDFTAKVTGLAVLLICIGILTRLFRHGSIKTNVPIPQYQWNTAGSAKKRWMWDSLNLLREGYFKFYDKPWQIWTSEGYQVVLPPAHVDELKMLQDHTFPSALREFMLPQYTFKPYPAWKLDYVNHVILHDLNKNMAKIFPAMRDEVGIGLKIDFPTSTNWSEVDVSAQMLRLTCRVSGSAFVGTELYRNEEWLDISCKVGCMSDPEDHIHLTLDMSLSDVLVYPDLFVAALKLRAIPSFLRPLAAVLIPDLRRVYQHNERARALIQPILQQREQKAQTVPGYTKPNDTIQWLHDLIPDEDKKDYAFQGVIQLAITAVSVQSTSKLIVNVILNLMKYTKYMPVLVEEIQTVLAECGGEWTLESMGSLEKLDSFIRESLRFEPPLTATFQRRALKPVTLSDGTTLPQDTLVLAAADAISFDPNFYPDPETFDGLRFYKLRQQGGGKLRHQFVATSKTQVQFGLGRHACPGRWFAGHVIKLVVASVLLNYDLKFRDGEEKLQTFLLQTTNMPHPKTRILVRKKEQDGL